jgi:hypothetical protein
MRGISRTRLAVVVAAVLALGGAATVWAGIPDANGTINGCYAKKRGKLRVVKSGKKCKKSEHALAWSQTGPAGPAGPKGDPGGAATIYTASGHRFLTGANYREVTALDLPVGRYLLVGRGQALNQQADAEVVACNVYDSAGRHLDTGDATVPRASLIETFSYGTLTFQRAFELLAPQRVRVECIDGDGTDGVGVFITLTAIPVGAVIDQSS